MEIQMDTYLYLSSTDSPVHPSNIPDDFTIDLPSPLNLEGRWECALIETNRKWVDIYCDWCMESIIEDSWKPILRKVKVNIIVPLYVQLRPGCKNRIRIYLKSNHNALPETQLTLHIRRIV